MRQILLILLGLMMALVAAVALALSFIDLPDATVRLEPAPPMAPTQSWPGLGKGNWRNSELTSF